MAKGLDLYGRPAGDPHYGEDDTAGGKPNFTAGILLAPEALPPQPGNPHAVGMRGKIPWAQTDAWYDKKHDMTFWVNDRAYHADATTHSAPKLDWKHLVREGFTNEPGSPQEAKAFEDLVSHAPIGTLHTFINGMSDVLREAYIPPLVSKLRKRLHGYDLSLAEDYSLVPSSFWKKELGNAMLGRS